MGRPKILVPGTLVLLVLLSFWQGCRKAEPVWQNVPGGPTKVLVTVPPLYCFAKNVAGDDAAVLCLRPAQGPHDFEPDTSDALKARKADLFLSIGLGLDEYTAKIVKESGNKKVQIIELGEDALKDAKLLLASEEHHEHGDKEEKNKEHKEGKEDEEHHHHDHGSVDPHVWLGIDQAVAMIKHVEAIFQKIDGKNKEKYVTRAAEYIKELNKVRQDGRAALKNKKNRKLIAMHESLAYFGRTFDLDIIGSIQPRPGMDPDGASMAKLVKECKARDVRVIAIEPQFPANEAETLRNHLRKKGVQVELVTIDPLETAKPAELDASFYVRKMRENISALAEKLP